MKILFASSLAFALSAAANPAPPSMPFDAIAWKPTATAKLSTGFKMGALQVRWEETTLAAVLVAAGAGTIQHQGDAGGSLYWLCYTVEGANGQRIWLEADGELGGQERAITRIVAEQLKNAKSEDGCPTLPRALNPLALSQGLWLGQTETNARRTLGKPSHTEGRWHSFDYQAKVTGSCAGGFDLTNWLLYKTENGHIETIMAGQVTSC